MNETTIKAFLAGALLPTITFYFFLRNRKDLSRIKSYSGERDISNTKEKDGKDHDEWDDDDDDSSGQVSLSEDNNTLEKDIVIKIDQWGILDAPYKMLLCVNTDLNMGKGKIAAQCCHAAVGCYKRSCNICPAAIRAWERTGCAKVALKCPDLNELERIARIASSKGIPLYLVEDAGRTQIAAGSRTVLGLFGPVNVFDGITDHLKLV